LQILQGVQILVANELEYLALNLQESIFVVVLFVASKLVVDEVIRNLVAWILLAGQLTKGCFKECKTIHENVFMCI